MNQEAGASWVSEFVFTGARRGSREDAVHPLFPKASRLTELTIGAAIEVHRDKGPGLIESIYEWCMMREFELRKLLATNQRVVRITYKGFSKDEPTCHSDF